MKYLLMEEYEEMKVYALDNVIYHKIEKKGYYSRGRK